MNYYESMTKSNGSAPLWDQDNSTILHEKKDPGVQHHDFAAARMVLVSEWYCKGCRTSDITRTFYIVASILCTYMSQ